MVPLNAWCARSIENYRRCVERLCQKRTHALRKFYTNTAGVQVLTVNPFEVLYGVKSRFSEENEASILPSTKEARAFQLVIALTARAERVVPQMVSEEQKLKMGDWALLRRENQPKESKFETRMWLRPYKVKAPA